VASISVASVALLLARMILTHHAWHLNLVWTLFLAWIPLWIALRLQRGNAERSGFGFWSAASVWLLFFPNAPYILTDLIHLPAATGSSWWTDLVLHLLFALSGLVAGFVSLRIMQGLVAARYGRFFGNLAALGASLLAGLGIYIGRIERWNSWDVVVNPVGLLMDSFTWVNLRSIKLILLFALLVLGAHVLLGSLVPAPPSPTVPGRKRPFLETP
jgi:uncharacterized membrane protein